MSGCLESSESSGTERGPPHTLSQLLETGITISVFTFSFTVRAKVDPPPPYSLLDRKISVFFYDFPIKGAIENQIFLVRLTVRVDPSPPYVSFS